VLSGKFTFSQKYNIFNLIINIFFHFVEIAF